MLILGNCLDILKNVKSNSVNAFITDLPYGTTSNKWDSVLDLPMLWKEVNRIGKENFVFITTSSQPFTSILVTSNIKQFKHEWIWIKNRGSNFANTVREPFKEHESVLVFSPGKWTYNKQMQPRTGSGINRVKYELNQTSKSENYHEFEGRLHTKQGELRVPSSWQKFNTVCNPQHPTQKPIELYEYLVKTYTNENDLILDPTMGSGTTGVACKNLNRKFIGIENDEKYYIIAKERIQNGTNA